MLARADQVIELTTKIAAVHESAIGTKRTFSCRPAMSAFGGKADIEIAARDVCF
jgi:hypothetical protein